MELSKIDFIRDQIGNAQGCILLLVKLSAGDNAQAAKDARDLLENLSSLDKFVIIMAKSNYFKPLLQRLSSGVFSFVIIFYIVFSGVTIYPS